jgi:hypothetical protein
VAIANVDKVMNELEVIINELRADGFLDYEIANLDYRIWDDDNYASLSLDFSDLPCSADVDELYNQLESYLNDELPHCIITRKGSAFEIHIDDQLMFLPDDTYDDILIDDMFHSPDDIF